MHFREVVQNTKKESNDNLMFIVEYIEPQIEENLELNSEENEEFTLIPVQINRNPQNATRENARGQTPNPQRLTSASPVNQDTIGSIMRMLGESNDLSNFDMNLDELSV